MANNTQHNPKMTAMFGPEVFELVRLKDETGISGTGRVAEGIVFSDGSVALRWLTKHRSTSFYESAREVLAIHGHGGKTEIRYRSPPNVSDTYDGRACSNCAHAMGAHCLDGAAICCAGGCTCCLVEHPEFQPIGERKSPLSL